MVDRNETALTFARVRELQREPVQGKFDVDHLREVHRRIFQDLPHHGPGEFRPDAPGHFKHRRLESINDVVVVPYALRSETDRLLGPTFVPCRAARRWPASTRSIWPMPLRRRIPGSTIFTPL